MAGRLGGRQCLFDCFWQWIFYGAGPSHRQTATDGCGSFSHLAIHRSVFDGLTDFTEYLLDDFLAFPEEDDTELAAAVVSAGDVESHQVFANDPGDVLQDIVADSAAITVVELLEIVDLDQDHSTAIGDA